MQGPSISEFVDVDSDTKALEKASQALDSVNDALDDSAAAAAVQSEATQEANTQLGRAALGATRADGIVAEHLADVIASSTAMQSVRRNIGDFEGALDELSLDNYTTTAEEAFREGIAEAVMDRAEDVESIAELADSQDIPDNIAWTIDISEEELVEQFEEYGGEKAEVETRLLADRKDKTHRHTELEDIYSMTTGLLERSKQSAEVNDALENIFEPGTDEILDKDHLGELELHELVRLNNDDLVGLLEDAGLNPKGAMRARVDIIDSILDTYEYENIFRELYAQKAIQHAFTPDFGIGSVHRDVYEIDPNYKDDVDGLKYSGWAPYTEGETVWQTEFGELVTNEERRVERRRKFVDIGNRTRFLNSIKREIDFIDVGLKHWEIATLSDESPPVNVRWVESLLNKDIGDEDPDVQLRQLLSRAFMDQRIAKHTVNDGDISLEQSENVGIPISPPRRDKLPPDRDKYRTRDDKLTEDDPDWKLKDFGGHKKERRPTHVLHGEQAETFRDTLIDFVFGPHFDEDTIVTLRDAIEGGELNKGNFIDFTQRAHNVLASDVPIEELPRAMRNAEGQFVEQLQWLNDDIIDGLKRIGVTHVSDLSSITMQDLTEERLTDRAERARNIVTSMQSQLNAVESAFTDMEEDDSDIIETLRSALTNLNTIDEFGQTIADMDDDVVKEHFGYLTNTAVQEAMRRQGIETTHHLLMADIEDMHEVFDTADKFISDIDTSNMGVIRKQAAIREIVDNPMTVHDIVPQTVIDEMDETFQVVDDTDAWPSSSDPNTTLYENLFPLNLTDIHNDTANAMEELNRQRFGGDINDTSKLVDQMLEIADMVDETEQAKELLNEADSATGFLENIVNEIEPEMQANEYNKWLDRNKRTLTKIRDTVTDPHTIDTGMAEDVQELSEDMFYNLTRSPHIQSDLTLEHTEALATVMTELDPNLVESGIMKDVETTVTDLNVRLKLLERLLQSEPGTSEFAVISELLEYLEQDLMGLPTVFDQEKSRRKFMSEFRTNLPDELIGTGLIDEIVGAARDRDEPIIDLIGPNAPAKDRETRGYNVPFQFKEDRIDNIIETAVSEANIEDAYPSQQQALRDMKEQFHAWEASDDSSHRPVSQLRDAFEQTIRDQLYLQAVATDTESMLSAMEADDQYSLESIVPGDEERGIARGTYVNRMQRLMDSLSETQERSKLFTGISTRTIENVPFLRSRVSNKTMTGAERIGIGTLLIDVLSDSNIALRIVNGDSERTGSNVRRVSSFVGNLNNSYRRLVPLLQSNSLNMGNVTIRMESALAMITKFIATLGPAISALFGLAAGAGIAAIATGGALAVGAIQFAKHLENTMATVNSEQEAMQTVVKQLRELVWYGLAPIRTMQLGGTGPNAFELTRDVLAGGLLLLRRFARGIEALGSVPEIRTETQRLLDIIHGRQSEKGLTHYLKPALRDILPLLVDIIDAFAGKFGVSMRVGAAMATTLLSQFAEIVSESSTAIQMIIAYGYGFQSAFLAFADAILYVIDTLTFMVNVIPFVDAKATTVVMWTGMLVGAVNMLTRTIAFVSSQATAARVTASAVEYLYNALTTVSTVMTVSLMKAAAMISMAGAAMLLAYDGMQRINDESDEAFAGLFEIITALAISAFMMKRAFAEISAATGAAQIFPTGTALTGAATGGGSNRGQVTIIGFLGAVRDLATSTAKAVVTFTSRATDSITTYGHRIGKSLFELSTRALDGAQQLAGTGYDLVSALYTAIAARWNSIRASLLAVGAIMKRIVTIIAPLIAIVGLTALFVKLGKKIGTAIKQNKQASETDPAPQQAHQSMPEEAELPPQNTFNIKSPDMSDKLDAEARRAQQSQNTTYTVQMRNRDDMSEKEFTTWVADNVSDTLEQQ